MEATEQKVQDPAHSLSRIKKVIEIALNTRYAKCIVVAIQSLITGILSRIIIEVTLSQGGILNVI